MSGSPQPSTSGNVLDRIPAEQRARLRFLTAVRRTWSTALFQQLHSEYEAAVELYGEPRDLAQAGALIEACASHAWFGWLERGGQQLKWRLITSIVEEHGAALTGPMPNPGPAQAILDPELEAPAWYRKWDIHCQPGGVGGDATSGLVYELGTKVLHVGRNDRNELHHLFVETVLEPVCPPARPTSIIDLGSGFGKSTTPIKAYLPEVSVYGVELSAPCVVLAATRASQAGLDVTFLQGDAGDLPFDDGSVGVVTGTMVLHEMPLQGLREVFAEAARVLEPGGAIRFLEFMRTGDLFRDAVMDDHAWRNNEPFMPGLMDLDIREELLAVGLVDARWVPFDERGGGPRPSGFAKRKEWHFPWAVLEARRPGGD